MVAGGLAAAVPGSFSAAAAHAPTSPSAVPSVWVGLASESPSWSPAELQAAATVPAPYTEPGLGLAGATHLGAPSLATAADPTGSINILITLAFSNGSELNTLLQELSNPASPQYHHYLTAAEFDSEFGATPSVYNSLVGYLTSFGVTGLTTYPDRVTVSFEATPPEVTAMFHTSLGSYVTSAGDGYYAPTSAPLIPAPLAPYVVDVEGLSDYSGYLIHLAPLASVDVPASALAADAARGGATLAGARPAASPEASHPSPGATNNPFASTTVTSNGFTATYDQPVNLNLSSQSGKTCDTTTCGDMIQAPDLQVAYNETGLLQKYGYPVNASVAAILWSDTICHADTGTCKSDGYYNYNCSTLTSGSAAWDFFMPDVTSTWNYTIPAGEPMPTAYSMAETGYTYAYPSGSQGHSASCDDAAAEDESTLDVSMLGSMAPGANVFQVFGGSNSNTAIDTAFADILSPSTTEFSPDGGFDTAAAVAKLENVSVITNSWTSSGALPAAWTTDLETAAARGITVLGATGDSGTTLAPPAEIANNAYGTVAVGGTTAAINRTTLLRGPPHLAAYASPYYGVGTGEIGWYEPAGTVDGFTTTYGGTGGVATSTTYYRATWFNASTDAVGVANLVRNGNYRAAPDVAAISNDTMIDLDQGPTSLNMTCWVTTSCTKISTLSVGTTSGSAPTVEATYFIGTSIAVQVTGGLVAVMDYALHSQHQDWLGFLDPAAYAMGQKQDAGQLTLQPFYDVTTYTDAGGLVANYEAKAGYDLATGWGVLDAGNYTQNTMTYNVTFTETGLPSGTSWSVAVTPTLGDANCTVSGSSCSNRATGSATGTTIVFPESYGLFTYTVASSNHQYLAPVGSFKVCGKPVAVSVTFSLVTYAATFTETELPSGTEWWVNVTSEPSLHSTGMTISTSLPNGSYTYTVASANKEYSASGGSFVVNGVAVQKTAAFALVTYEVTFIETGLPLGTEWWVNVTGGASYVSTTSMISISEPNGSYAYTVGSVVDYTVRPNSGTMTIDGGPAFVTITYALPAIAVTPGQGPVGSAVTVTGTNFSSASAIGIVFDSTAIVSSSCTSGSLVTNSTGAFSCTIQVPGGTVGTAVTATDVTGAYASAWFSVTIPTLAASPSQGPVGATVTVIGHGFSVDAPLVSLVFDSVTITSCLSGSLTTGTVGPGAFSCTIQVPGGTVGTAVTATDVTGAYASAWFSVTIPTLAASPSQGPVGATVTVIGHGFSVDAPLVSLVFDSVTITSCLSGSLTTGTVGPGAFSCTIQVPGGTVGTTVTATDVTGTYATTMFTVTARTLATSPNQRSVVTQGFEVAMVATGTVFPGPTSVDRSRSTNP
jgi:hypothetical protein